MKFNKTDDELKTMSDDELFEYLDAKAEYLANVEFDYDSVKKIAKENDRLEFEKFIKDKK